MHKTVDFCVVGAGPAGLTLTLLLLRSGATVALVERAGSFDREYRGEVLQPGGLTVLDQLGVLEPAIRRGSHRLSGFQLIGKGKPVLDVDYSRFAGEFNYLLSIPQRHLLEELLEQCCRQDGFVYIERSHPVDLCRDSGRGIDLRIMGRNGEQVIRANCVIGSDGRHSKIRRLASIEYERSDMFGHDLLWFKIPATCAEPETVRIVNAHGSAAVIHRSYPDRVQIGWAMPHGSYRQIAAGGIDRVKERIRLALPEYGDAVDTAITGLGQLTLLDVFGGMAQQWVADQVVLIGDAAHTHGPLGAQGINLAIQDAAALHPILLAALQRGDFRAEVLAAFPESRRRDIERVMKFQEMQSKAMLSQGNFAAALRPVLLAIFKRTPAFRKVTMHVAYGNPAIRARTGLAASGAGPGGNQCA